MKHISADIILNAFSPSEVIEIVKKGVIALSNGSYHIPERMHIDRGKSTTLIMPAFSSDYFCTKLISVDPENKDSQLPVISGLLILNQNSDGKVLASMDAPAITALRTAAVGSIGIELIHSDQINKLGIIGLGVQGYWQTFFALSTQKITDVFCTSRSKQKFNAYADKINAQFPNINVHWCDDANDVVNNSELIITCTTAKEPVFNGGDIDIELKRFISVGSFNKDMQELPKEVYQKADILLLDTESAKTEVGDVINALNQQWIEEDNIVTLSQVLGNKKTLDNQQIIVFKSVGMAAFDLALAIAIHEKISQEQK